MAQENWVRVQYAGESYPSAALSFFGKTLGGFLKPDQPQFFHLQNGAMIASPLRSSHHDSGVMNPTSIHEDAGLIAGPAQWVNDPALL